MLDGDWGIVEGEGHDHVLIMAKPGPERGLPFFSFCHSYQVADATQVEFGEPFGFEQPRQCFLNQGEGVVVLVVIELMLQLSTHRRRESSPFLMNRTGALVEEELVLMKPFERFSSMDSLSARSSFRDH